MTHPGAAAILPPILGQVTDSRRFVLLGAVSCRAGSTTNLSERQVVLTPAGLKRIEEELHELLTVRRQEVAELIRQAKDLGDVAENPEYETAKTEQAFLESRISELKTFLQTAVVVGDDEIRTDVVSIGSVARVRDLEADEEWEYTVVGSYEADPEADLISNESPIGQALCGHGVGEVVSIRVPAGTVRYEIVGIRRPDEPV